MDPDDGTTYLTTAISELTHSLDIVEFLEELTRTASSVGDAAAVGIVLADDDKRLRYMAASSRDAALLQVVEGGLDEGPCPEAYHSGERVVVTDLAEGTTRWRSFVDVARVAGFRSALVLPLSVDSRPIGAIGWFGRSAGSVVDAADVWPGVLADLAAVAVAVAQDDRARRSGSLVAQVRQALASRAVVEQAKGAVAATDGVDPDVASERLRTYAHRHDRRLVDVAEEVVSRPRHARSWWLEEVAGGPEHPA